eukprot:86168-Rhodomonas_salina.1
MCGTDRTLPPQWYHNPLSFDAMILRVHYALCGTDRTSCTTIFCSPTLVHYAMLGTDIGVLT